MGAGKHLWDSPSPQEAFGFDRATSEGQEALIQIAKAAVENNSMYFLRHLRNYGIDSTVPAGKKAMIEIAQTLVKKRCDISNHFELFGIDHTTPEGQTVLMEMAKLAAQFDKKGEHVSKYIYKYRINTSTPEGKQAEIEIAKYLKPSLTADLIAQPHEIEYHSHPGKQVLMELGKLKADKQWMRPNLMGIDATSPEGRQLLLEVVQKVNDKDITLVSRCLHYYGIDSTTIEGQQFLIELAKKAALVDIKALCQSIQNYDIDRSNPQSQKALIEIAKTAAQKESGFLATYIKNFGIDAKSPEGQKSLVEIATLAAQECRNDDVTKHIKNFCIDSSTKEGLQALIDIAKIIAQKHSGNISQYISCFDIDVFDVEGLQALVEIARLAISSNTENTSEFMQEYGFGKLVVRGKKVITDIAKEAAAENGSGLSQYIHAYGIDPRTSEGLKTLIEVAELALQSSQGWASEYIKNYQIDTSSPEGRQALIHLACVSAEINSYSTSKHLQSYSLAEMGPEGLQALYDIAKIAAENSGGTYLHEHINNYGFHLQGELGQTKLIEIAKLAVQHVEGWKTIQNIDSFCIQMFSEEGQQGLIDIVKLAARQQDGGKIAQFMDRYGIDNSSQRGQEALIEIAQILAKNCGNDVSEHIQKFRIDGSTLQGKEALVNIAILAAQQDGWAVSACIKNYGIDNKTLSGQEALIKIAMAAAQQNGAGTSQHIQNYGMDVKTPEGQKAHCVIAKQAIKQNASGTYNNLSHYSFETDSAEGKHRFAELSNYLLIHLLIQINNFTYKEFIQNIDKIKPNVIPMDGIATYNYALGKPILGLIKKLPDEEIKSKAEAVFNLCEEQFKLRKYDLDWARKALIKKANDPFIQKRFLEWFTLTAAMCCFREDLAALFKQQLKLLWVISKRDPELRVALTKEFIYLSFSLNTPFLLTYREASEFIVHNELACLVLAHFPSEGKEVYIKFLRMLKIEREFKAGNLQKPLLEVLLKIKDSQLPDPKKIALIDFFSQMPLQERVRCFRFVCDLLNFKGESYLCDVKTTDELSKVLAKMFEEQMDINVDGFPEKYEKTLMTWRNKDAIFTYASKINQLNTAYKPKAIQLYKEALSFVLEGTFSQKRYQTETNPHLAEINQNYPLVYQKWQQPIELDAKEIEVANFKNSAEPISVAIIKTLKEAIAQEHLGGNMQAVLFPVISRFCKDNGDPKPLFDEVIKQLIPLSDRRLTKEEAPVKNRLLIERSLLKLFIQPEDMDVQLKQIKGLLNSNMEFYQDIEGALNRIKAAAAEKRKQDIKVIDTDDPNHILLMGTEVYNSCQRVNGSPDHNKCLLGFFLDGKHRLGLVCNAQGKILARSVFRLLIDSLGQPVLYQEVAYLGDQCDNSIGLLRRLAIKKALNIGVPLAAGKSDSESKEALQYPHSLLAKGKPVPFEYVDALRRFNQIPIVWIMSFKFLLVGAK